MDIMTPSMSDPSNRPAPARQRRTGVRWLMLLVAVGAATAGGWWYFSQRSDEPVVEEATAAPRFAEVVRTDLVEVDTYDGTLGRADGDPIVNGANGILTAVPAPGSTVRQGEVLYRVDNYPIVMLNGELPAWRALKEGVDDGPDVQQLEVALVALGYDADETVTIDEEFTHNTEQMVQRWQEDLGVDDDGVVELGEVVFLPDEVRIADVTAEIGSTVQGGGQFLVTSSAEIVVTVDLPTADQGVLAVGGGVTVVLPDNTETPGTVITVGTIAISDAQGEATVEVEVRLVDPSVAGNLDEAPVEIEVVADSARAVIAVPVTALVALSEGGYAVQLIEADGTLHLVAVDPGFFADGLVEVTSDGLEPGDQVVIP